ncbi:hypothetical protein PMIN04_000611 [Paraphaeosphaeria minitans]
MLTYTLSRAYYGQHASRKDFVDNGVDLLVLRNRLRNYLNSDIEAKFLPFGKILDVLAILVVEVLLDTGQILGVLTAAVVVAAAAARRSRHRTEMLLPESTTSPDTLSEAVELAPRGAESSVVIWAAAALVAKTQH